MPFAFMIFSFSWLRLGFSWAFLAIGVIGGLFFFWKKAREEHFDLISAVDTLGLGALWAAVAARVAFVVFQAGQFQFRPLAWINIFGYPGMWAPAGLLAFFFVLWWRSEELKEDFWELWDFSSIYLAWFLFWHWLSRFAVGAAAGIPTQLPIGVVFPSRVEPAHPVQLYSAVFFAFAFAFLWWVEPRYRFFLWYRSRKRTAKTGFLFCVFLIILGLQGMITSVFQYPFVSIWDIDLNQIVSVGVFFAGLILLYSRSGRTLFFVTRKTETERSV